MRAFVPTGTKFTSHGMTWIASPERSKNPGTAIAEKIQVWFSKKTWLRITCRYDLHRERLKWEVDRYDSSSTRSGAAAMAASQTREALDLYVKRLSEYGNEIEKRHATAILKKNKPKEEEDV